MSLGEKIICKIDYHLLEFARFDHVCRLQCNRFLFGRLSHQFDQWEEAGSSNFFGKNSLISRLN